MRPTEPRDRLVVALDVPAAAEALALARALGPSAGVLKVGSQLFTAAGPDLVRALLAEGHRVFLDLKLHDIPNTVAGAVASASGLGVHLLTLHALGGKAMLEAAVAARREPTTLLAVTVLTSQDEGSLAEVGVAGPVPEAVGRLAHLARQAEVGGLVCSPHEVALVRRAGGAEMLLVTPGIRPAGSERGDQARAATPAAALAAGADYLVVGRPITAARDPAAAAAAIVAEMATALAEPR